MCEDNSSTYRVANDSVPILKNACCYSVHFLETGIIFGLLLVFGWCKLWGINGRF